MDERTPATRLKIAGLTIYYLIVYTICLMKIEMLHIPEIASAQFAALLKRFDDTIPRRTHFNALFDALVFGRSSIRQIAKPPSVGKNVPVCDTPDDAYRAYQRLLSNNKVVLDLERNGAVTPLTYEVKN